MNQRKSSRLNKTDVKRNVKCWFFEKICQIFLFTSQNSSPNNHPWIVHFIQRFVHDPKRTLTRSRSATDATRFLRHNQARISTAIKCDSNNEYPLHSTLSRSLSVPNHLSFHTRIHPLNRSASMHDLHQHEVYRAKDLEFGSIIGQGFYGIARMVQRKTLFSSSIDVRFHLG